MRFFISRNDERVCQFCQTNILHGEHYVLMFMPKARRSFFFHVVNVKDDCFMEWTRKMFNRKYMEWIQNLNPPVKRGRPPKYKDGKKANQLIALKAYYTKAGNTDRVEFIIQELEVLKC